MDSEKANSGKLTLSARELQLVAIAWRCLVTNPQVSRAPTLSCVPGFNVYFFCSRTEPSGQLHLQESFLPYMIIFL